MGIRRRGVVKVLALRQMFMKRVECSFVMAELNADYEMCLIDVLFSCFTSTPVRLFRAKWDVEIAVFMSSGVTDTSRVHMMKFWLWIEIIV